MKAPGEQGGPGPLLGSVERATGAGLSRCFQCRKCSAGCPAAAWMDVLPHEFVRLLELGRPDEVFASRTLWVCTDCKTCVTRCPNSVDIPRAIEHLKRTAISEKIAAAENNAPEFVDAFYESIRKGGRVHELGMMRRYKMATGDLFSDLKLGWGLFRRGKLRLFGGKVKGLREVRAIFDEAGKR